MAFRVHFHQDIILIDWDLTSMATMASDAFIAGCPFTLEDLVILAPRAIIAYKGVKMKFLYLDTETTGVNPKEDSIFQISCIYIDTEALSNGPEEYDFKLAPYKNKGLSPMAKEKTGMTDEEINSYPPQDLVFEEFREKICAKVNSRDRGDKMFLLGYNISFDDSFLREWFSFNGDRYYGSYFWNPCIDAMPLAGLRLMAARPFMPNFQLSTVYKALTGKDLEGAHDAMSDVRATKEIFDILFSSLN